MSNRVKGSPSTLTFTSYCLTSKLYCGRHSSVYCPTATSPAKPTLLQYCCTTIAQYTPPHRPSCICHTPYNIGDGNIVQRSTRPKWCIGVHVFLGRRHKNKNFGFCLVNPVLDRNMYKGKANVFIKRSKYE